MTPPSHAFQHGIWVNEAIILLLDRLLPHLEKPGNTVGQLWGTRWSTWGMTITSYPGSLTNSPMTYNA